MTRALLSLLAAAVAGGVTWALVRGAAPSAPIRRTNYRGIPVAAGMGVVLVAGVVAGAAALGLVASVLVRTGVARTAALVGVPLLALAGGFAMLGLWDDLSEQPERGFRGHVGALCRGRTTTGGLKLLAGAGLAIAVAAPFSRSLWWAIAHGALIALFANLFNAFDLRPGRAVKFFLVAAIPLAALTTGPGPIMAAAAGAAAGFLPADLRERAMLGDAGANALGALVGGAVVFSDPAPWTIAGLLVALLGLTAVAESPGFSAIIRRVPPLRAFDAAGRVAEDASDARA